MGAQKYCALPKGLRYGSVNKLKVTCLYLAFPHKIFILYLTAGAAPPG